MEIIIDKLLSKINDKVSLSETNALEIAIANDIKSAIQKDSFYTLPIKNILRIIGQSSINDSSLICELVEMATKVKGDDAILLLNVLDAKEYDFSECIRIISKFTNCSLCNRVGMLYSIENNTIERDYEYEINLLKEKVQNLEKERDAKPDFESDIFKASEEGKLTSVQYLVERCHTNVEIKDDCGFSPLYVASLYDRLEIVKYLYEKCHADPEAKSNSHWTPIMTASFNGNIEVVKYLYETCHAKVDAMDNSNETALCKAAINNHFEIVKYLCETCHAKISKLTIEKASSEEIKTYLKIKNLNCTRPHRKSKRYPRAV